MSSAFECGVTASFLRSGQALSSVSNCAAVIASIGILLAHPILERLAFAASLLCWPVTCYFSVRVAIDASLFRELAGRQLDGERAALKLLDELLRDWGFAQAKAERPLPERSRGALALWKRLIVVITVQLALLAAAMVIQILAP